MTTAGQPTGYFNQTYCVEFTVEGDLDGTTVSPPILDSPPTGANEGDPQGLFRRTVDELGLIDADYLVPLNEEDRRGSRGNRLITFLWIEGSSPGDASASVDVVDAVDGGAGAVQKKLDVAPFGSLVGSTTFFREGIFLPQGSMLRIRGMSGSAADPIKVRLHIQFVNGARDLAAVLVAICCLEEPATNPPTGPASGDLGAPGGAPTAASGNYPNPAVVGIQQRRVDPTAPLFQQALLWNGLAWAPAFVGIGQVYFGAESLGILAGSRFLPPGFDLSGTALPATEIPIKATQNQVLRFLHVQQTPGVGAGTITYEVFVSGAASGLSVTLPVTATDANDVVSLPTALSNNNISVRITLAGAVVTAPSRCTATFQALAA